MPSSFIGTFWLHEISKFGDLIIICSTSILRFITAQKKKKAAKQFKIQRRKTNVPEICTH